MPSPGGPPPQCFGPEDHAEHSSGHDLFLGFGLGSFNSTLRFEDQYNVDIKMTTASLSLAWPLDNSWTLRAGLGAILNGELTPAGADVHDVEPGVVATVGAEYVALIGADYTPFVDLSIFLSGSFAETVNPMPAEEKTKYTAFDLRLGARAGWDINSDFFPYVAARVFGGPVSWKLNGQDVTGSDINQYQIAIGAAYRFGPGNIFAEWGAMGENAVSAGFGFRL